jgi:hypothetical protein
MFLWEEDLIGDLELGRLTRVSLKLGKSGLISIYKRLSGNPPSQELGFL